MAKVVGKPQARVHEAFQQRLKEWRELAEKQIAAERGAEQPGVWQFPQLNAKYIWGIDKLHSPAWDREEINKNYEECFQGEEPGTVGDVMALRLQLDLLAAEERAFRLRHASTARMMAHGAIHTQALAGGIVPDTVRQYVASLIEAGAQKA